MDSGSTCVLALFHHNHMVVANVGDSRCLLCRNHKQYPLSSDHKPHKRKEKLRITKSGHHIDDTNPDCHRIASNQSVMMLATSRCFGDFEFKNNPNLGLDALHVYSPPPLSFFTHFFFSLFVYRVHKQAVIAIPEIQVARFHPPSSSPIYSSSALFASIGTTSASGVTQHGRSVSTTSNSQLSFTKDDFAVLFCDGVSDVMENWEVVKFLRWRLQKRGRNWKRALSDLFLLCLQRFSSDNLTMVIVDFDARNRVFEDEKEEVKEGKEEEETEAETQGEEEEEKEEGEQEEGKEEGKV